MLSLSDIPAELCEEIFSHLIKAAHLASVARVCKVFHDYAMPILYEQIYIYHWHGDSKARVVKLFNTLSKFPQLAAYLRKLVVTDPPKLVAVDHAEDLFVRGLRNCKALRACSWTRDGALTSGILETLQYCPALTSLEINGRSEYKYRADLLLGFRRLEELTIVMPDAGVIRHMEAWFGHTGQTLRRLTLICKASPLVNDETLKAWAPHLANLEHFSLVGCPKVTHQSIWAVISGNTHGIRSLGLEGLSPRFDLVALNTLCSRSPTHTLAHLSSITLTIGPMMPAERFADDALALLANCPLERAHVYSTGKIIGAPVLSKVSTPASSAKPTARSHTANASNLLGNALHSCSTTASSSTNHIPFSSTPAFPSFIDTFSFPSASLTDSFCLRLTALHSARLTRLAAYKMVLSLRAVDVICTGCPALEQLFVVVDRGDMATIATSLAKAPRLRSVHINYPQDVRTGPLDVQDIEAQVVPRCGPMLRQFGCNTKVWQVERRIERASDGTDEIRAHLGPYERLEVPEQFLVVRA
ncbi:hypothetical protein HDZ31DRAFT_35190 [Schizophyllum fasciatum]